MIRTDIDIKDDIVAWLEDSNLVKALSGNIYKDKRPLNSKAEDIIIAIIARDADTQIQLATANINIYIPDIRRGQEAVEDTPRLRTVATLAAQQLEYFHFGDGIFSLQSQEVMEANGIDWHIINNRLNIKYSNE